MALEHSDGLLSMVVAMMIVHISELVVELFGLNGCDEFLGNFFSSLWSIGMIPACF